MKFSLIPSLFLAFFLFLPQLSGSDKITLAADGKTAYAIAVSGRLTEDETEAVKDLARYLKKITGADFPVIKDKKTAGPVIWFGKKAPGDNNPLSRRERRIKRSGRDIYIYGETARENAFAVYDFLETYFSCRWYSAWGDEDIPVRLRAELDKVDFCRVPSYETADFGARDVLMNYNPRLRSFRRKQRFYFVPRYFKKNENTSWTYIGAAHHAMSSWLPPGNRGVAQFKNAWMGAHPALKDKKYFKTNPEFFTLNEKGVRVDNKLLCFSNRELRRVFTENLEIGIAWEKYDPAEYGVISLDVNDNSGPFCCCADCRKLNEKYGTPAGAYFDYILELAPEFKKKYPNLILRFLAYEKEMTEIPPKGVQFPDNAIPYFAPIQGDFLKPYTAPVNGPGLQNLRNWSKVSKRIWLWLYPNSYNRPLQNYPLTAGVHRIASDMKTAYKYNARMLMAEFGGNICTNMAFKELWLYVIARLADDITRDEKQLVQEFIRGYYGKAAPDMLKYFNELEELAAKESRHLRWYGDIRLPSYVNAGNLLRWQKAFDTMEKKAAASPRHLLHVKRVRLNLDHATVAVWDKIRTAAPDWATEKQLDRVYNRFKSNLRADIRDMYSGFRLPPHLKKEQDARYALLTRGGMDSAYAEAKGPVIPLPEEFLKKNKGRKIWQIAPGVNKGMPDLTPGSAFGITVEGWTSLKKLWLVHHKVNNKREVTVLPNKILMAAPLRRAGNKYNLHYAGAGRLTYDTTLTLTLPNGRASLNCLGHIFDPAAPEKQYDIYLSLKFKEPNRYLCDRIVVVEK